MTTRPAPIIAAVLLLLPVLYVGSYLALIGEYGSSRIMVKVEGGYHSEDTPYRCCPEICKPLFWPLEQIDRRLRPKAWELPYKTGAYPS
jgi:hypothetical protein